MNDYLLAIILGIVEGLTEFIPVSSTAHLRITQAILDVPLDNEFWKMFSVVIQLGAILSVVFYFSKRILNVMRSHRKTTLKLSNQKSWQLPFDPLCSKVLVSFIVTAVPAFLLSKIISDNLESLIVMGSSLILGGVVMIFIDTKPLKIVANDVEQINFRQAAAIGAIQILSAVFPGVSRSMSTIVGGQLVGLSRAAALEFSFLVSIPTMFAATGYDLLKSSLDPNINVLQTTHEWLVLFVGSLTSFFVAYAVVAWLMNWVRTHTFVFFGYYRIIIGAYVLFLALFAS